MLGLQTAASHALRQYRAPTDRVAQLESQANSAKKSAIIDILTWVECFNSYIAVLTTFYPPRSRDLLAYMALIVRTAKQFGETAWLDYDRAFRREAAASNLRDWSVMRPDLYNYHTALISVNRLGSNKSDANRSPQRNFRNEARGQPPAKQCCISWNKGFCSSDHKFCRYRHSCSAAPTPIAMARTDFSNIIASCREKEIALPSVNTTRQRVPSTVKVNNRRIIT